MLCSGQAIERHIYMSYTHPTLGTMGRGVHVQREHGGANGMTQEGVNPDPKAFIVPGCHVAFVINASDKGYYKWHDFCVRCWLNLNFHGVLNNVTWLERLCTVVWLALNALALGENVLVHCRQGKHRSGALVMLLLGIMPHLAWRITTPWRKHTSRRTPR